MSSALKLAILRTVLYADVFRFAMTPREIHHRLICATPTAARDVDDALATLCADDGPLTERDGYVCLAAMPELIELRRQREAHTARLLPVAIRYGRWLAALPFIRMVALTGAVAVRNPVDDRDDLDYLLVTAPGRVWLARAFSILLVRFVRLHGYELCPNYVLSATALKQERENLFIAHEVAQMQPLYGIPLYRQMRNDNAWAARYLPNAVDPLDPLPVDERLGFMSAVKQVTEWLLSSALGNALERWEQRRKLRRFTPALQVPDHDARLDRERVKGHFNDHGHRVLSAYAERLRAHDCAEEAAAAD